MQCHAILLFTVLSLTPLQQLSTRHIVDLSYPFDADTVYWPTAETFKLDYRNALVFRD